MGFFSRLFSRITAEPAAPVAPIKAPGAKTVTHKVASVNRYQKELQAMGEKNPDYNLTKRELVKRWPDGVTVYEYTFNPQKAELVPDPGNEYNPKAIKVFVDGVRVGYIKDGSCAHIHRLLQENRIQSIKARIIGGKYKAIWALDQDARSVEDYEFEKGVATINVRLDITELPPATR